MIPWKLLPLLAILLGLALSTASCRDERTDRIVANWLLCTECSDNELDSIQALDHRAVEPLARALRGPTPAERQHMQLRFEALYDELAAHATRYGEPLSVTRQDYVNRLLENLDALYRVRAAEGLEVIGSSAADEALQNLLAEVDSGTVTLRPDVEARLRALAATP
jgi:hypothetical protein